MASKHSVHCRIPSDLYEQYRLEAGGLSNQVVLASLIEAFVASAKKDPSIPSKLFRKELRLCMVEE